MRSPFLDALERRVLVLDGAMGTMIQSLGLPLADYRGLENCSEILNLTRPDAIEAIHGRYLDAGCDAVETNTFGANRIVLGEFGLADRVREINRVAAEIARAATAPRSSRERPRFVIGSAGPGTRLPSLGQVSWDDLFASYREQGLGLLDGGVDAILVETCQDLLQARCAVAAMLDAMDAAGRNVPLIAQVTMEAGGTMLLGSDIGAAVTVLSAYPLAALGINCATGPREMSGHVKQLASLSPMPVSVLPNAGLPELVDGATRYPLGPSEFADWLVRFVEEDGVGIVGGCCGSTVEHIEELARRIGDRAPRPRHPDTAPRVASLYTSVTLEQDASVLMIGERTNANGSKRFRRLLEAGDFDGIVEMAREQVAEGSHVLDVCTAYVGRDESEDMRRVVRRLATEVTAPLMIDSTEPAVIEAALRLAGGRCIVNSVNFEDGEERCAAVLPLVRKYGAAVVGLTIDEEGMARTAERKLAVARRLRERATGDFGIPEGDLIIDPLTFTVCTGQESDRRLAVETLDAIGALRAEMPAVHTMLGLSNVSFGIAPAARHVLNSVFLHHARECGLSAAIVHAAGIVPLYRVPERERTAAEDLIFDRRRPDHDPLAAFLALFAGGGPERAAAAAPAAGVEDRLRRRIVDGARRGLEADLEEALRTREPLEIINAILLDGMRTVGELFGRGEMQLPFVLQSAETMKAAVAFLEPRMARSAGSTRGRMVLATVRGDVHDIGKNLVDILLTNNGYTVINLGIKQPIEAILDAARKHGAEAIGLSGLLVKSTVIMKENLEEMRRQGVTLPVILGGAALTRRFVEDDCRRAYGGRVAYAKDAFDGLRFMDEVSGGGAAARAAAPGGIAEVAPHRPAAPGGPAAAPGRRPADRPVAAAAEAAADEGPPSPRRDVPVPRPPFFGRRHLEHLPLRALLPWVNERMLFSYQWGFQRQGRSDDDYEALLTQEARPVLRRLAEQCERDGILAPTAAFGFWPCRAEGQDLVVLDPGRGSEVTRFTFPRQARGRRRSIVDWFRSDPSGEPDVVAFQAVTVGRAATELALRWFADNRYRDYLFLHGFSVECAEALAEYVHRTIRADLGIGGDDSREIAGLFRKGYRGCRFSFGYPACPRLEDQARILELLEADRIGISLTEEFQLEPEQSTTAIVVHHPDACYFTI